MLLPVKVRRPLTSFQVLNELEMSLYINSKLPGRMFYGEIYVQCLIVVTYQVMRAAGQAA